MGWKPRHRRVAVHWDDASNDYGWKPSDDDHRCGYHVVTMGFVVKRDKEAIFVAQSVAPDGMAADVMRIPKGCILRIERV